MRESFGSIEIDRGGRRVLRDGVVQKLEPRALDMLLYLVANPGRIVGRDELLAEVWRSRSLSEGVLATAVAKLRKVLGQAPEAQTPIETVRGHGYRWVVPADMSPPQPEHVLVERATCLGVMSECLDLAAQGAGSWLVLSGNPGCGKTRLLRELARLAKGRGIAVWTGFADASSFAPPYLPWAELLRSAHRTLGAVGLRACLPAGGSALATLVPELELAQQQSPRQDPSRASVYAELRHLLVAASAQRPIVVALDDMQWADSVNLDLLAQLARSLAGHSLMFVAAAREHASLPETRQAALRSLTRSARILLVQDLTREACAELAEQLQGAPCTDSEAREALYRLTRGNPLFVRQVVELLLQRGQRVELAALRALDLPEAWRDIVHERVASLPPLTAAAIATGSVIGLELEIETLAELMGCPAEQALDALQPALAQGLLQQVEGAVQRYAFVHGLVRDTLYAELPANKRGALHAQLVEVLSERSVHTVHGVRGAAAVAQHALCAVPFALERCVAACRGAAQAARDCTEFEGAAEILKRLLVRVVSEGGEPPLQAALLHELGSDQYGAGDLAGAFDTLLRAAKLARAQHEPALLAQITFRLLDCLEVGAGDEVEVRAVLNQALALVSEPQLKAALLGHSAELATELAFCERAALLDEADSMLGPDESGPFAVEIACCRTNLRDPSQLDHARAAAARLRALLSQPTGWDGELRRATRLFSAECTDYLCSLGVGDLAASERHALQARTLASECPLLPVRLAGLSIEAGQALAEARLDDASVLVAAMHELCARVTGGLAHQWLYFQLLLIDEREQWSNPPSGTFSELPTTARSRFADRTHIFSAFCAAKLGQPALSRALLERVRAPELARMPVLHGDLGSLCMLAETYALIGEQSAAPALLAQLAPYCERVAIGPLLEYRGVVSYYLGLLAELLSQSDQAAQYFARAHKLHSTCNMPLYKKRSQAALARVRTES